MVVLFEDWVYDATIETANTRNKVVERRICIEDNGAIKMMQKMVGAGISKAFKSFCLTKKTNDPIHVLLSNVCWKHADAIVNAEYKAKWYPLELQIENKGKLHLIHPTFIHWSSTLILFAAKISTKLNMIKYRRNAICVGLHILKNDDVLFQSFKLAALTNGKLCDGVLDDTTFQKIHLFLANYAFKAYTGFRWGDQFKGDKDSSDDATNLAFCQLLQTTGLGDGAKSTSEKKTHVRRRRGP